MDIQYSEFQANQVLVEAGRDWPFVCFVLRGSVSYDRWRTIEIDEGGIVGALDFFGVSTFSDLSALRALSDGVIAGVGAKQLEWLFARHGDLAAEMLHTVRRSVGRSVRPSVRPSVLPSVRCPPARPPARLTVRPCVRIHARMHAHSTPPPRQMGTYAMLQCLEAEKLEKEIVLEDAGNQSTRSRRYSTSYIRVHTLHM